MGTNQEVDLSTDESLSCPRDSTDDTLFFCSLGSGILNPLQSKIVHQQPTCHMQHAFKDGGEAVYIFSTLGKEGKDKEKSVSPWAWLRLHRS